MNIKKNKKVIIDGLCIEKNKDEPNIVLTLNVNQNNLKQVKTEVTSQENTNQEFTSQEVTNQEITFPITNDYIEFRTSDLSIDYTQSSTKVCCWWCCHTFTGTPIAIPTHYNTLKEIFKVYGNFCSFPCAKSFLIERSESTLYLLTYFKKCITGDSTTIKQAPPRLALTMFGGNMDIEEFRNCSDTVSVINKPYFGFNSQLEYVKVKEIVNHVPKNSSLKIQRISSKKESGGLSKLGIKTIKKQ